MREGRATLRLLEEEVIREGFTEEVRHELGFEG